MGGNCGFTASGGQYRVLNTTTRENMNGVVNRLGAEETWPFGSKESLEASLEVAFHQRVSRPLKRKLFGGISVLILSMCIHQRLEPVICCGLIVVSTR